METFEVFPHLSGSGSSTRLSLRVAVKWFVVPQGYEEQKPICLTADADDPREFDSLVDELIAELETLKGVCRRKFRDIQRLNTDLGKAMR